MGLFANARPRGFAGLGSVGKGLLALFTAGGTLLGLVIRRRRRAS